MLCCSVFLKAKSDVHETVVRLLHTLDGRHGRPSPEFATIAVTNFSFFVPISALKVHGFRCVFVGLYPASQTFQFLDTSTGRVVDALFSSILHERFPLLSKGPREREAESVEAKLTASDDDDGFSRPFDSHH